MTKSLPVDPLLVELLSDQQLTELETLLEDTGPEVWQPLPGPQTMAMESLADIVGYGGAAGGGKTDLAIGLALTRHEVVQVFRREGTELRAIIDRMEKIVGHRNGLGGKPPIWRNPTARCQVVEFCSVPNPGDEVKFQGRPKDLLVFDEAANFLESQIRFVLGWVRTTTPGQRARTLLTFNPPTTVEGRWVIPYFGPWLDDRHPKPAKPGELRWFATIAGRDVEVEDNKPFVLVNKERVYTFTASDYDPTDIIRPMSRTFIPSRVVDNPYLMNTGYVTTLQGLPEPLRSQMLYGDFKAGMQDDPWQVIPTAWVQAAQARWKKPDQKPPMDSLGVDVAMGGKDNTVLARRHGYWFDEAIVYSGEQSADGPTIAGFCVAAARNNAVIHIDVFGVGAQPYGHLMQLNQQVIGVVVGEPATGVSSEGRLRFKNLRSELWWRMREALDPTANTGIALPPDSRLLADLCAPTWEKSGPFVKVASREEIIDRIGRSPDFGSAYVLALMDTPKRVDIKRRFGEVHKEHDPYAAIRPNKISQDYDPYR